MIDSLRYKKLSGILALLPLLLLFLAGYLYWEVQHFVITAVPVSGVVVGYRQHHDRNGTTLGPNFLYLDQQGQQYVLQSANFTNPPRFKVGQTIEIFYDQSHPENARVNDWWELYNWVIILGSIGVIWFGIILATLVVVLRKKALNNWLKSNGQLVVAKVIKIEPDDKIIQGGKPLYTKIICEWTNPATGIVHTGQKGALPLDTSKYIKNDQVNVWVDPKNPQKFLIDIPSTS